MDMQKLHQFAEKYYQLYKNPNTRDRDVFEGFAEECFSLGLKSDLGKSFVEAYSQEAADYPEALKAIAHAINNPQLLGNAIFSKWRFITHWAESSLLDDNYRKWFIIALRRLCEIT